MKKLIFLSLILILIIYIFYDSYHQSLDNIDIKYIIIPFILFLSQETLNPLFSGMALSAIQQKSKYSTLFIITLFSTSTNSTVPVPAGVPIRAFLQKKLLDIPYSKSYIGILIEAIIDYGLSAIMAFILAYFYLVSIWKKIIIWLDQNNLFIILFLIIISLLIYIFIKIVKNKIKYKVERINFLPIMGMFLIMIIYFLLDAYRLYFILDLFNYKLDIGSTLAVLIISRIVGVISLSPMGLGTRDFTLASLLALLGIPLEVAIMASAIDRFIIILFYILGGSLSSWIIAKKYFIRFSELKSNDVN